MSVERQGNTVSWPVATDQVIHKDSLVVLKDGACFAGAQQGGQGAGLALKQGAEYVVVNVRGVFKLSLVQGETCAHVNYGSTVYVASSTTVSLDSSSNTRTPLGVVFEACGDEVWVEFGGASGS